MSHHSLDFEDDSDPLITNINVTPFVDVMLVLLVVFLVTSHFIDQTKGIQIQLPKASTSQANNPTTSFSISVTAQGQYMLHGKAASLEELSTQLSILKEQHTTPSVTISADASVAYDKVIKLMDVLRSQGVQDFALQTDSTTKP